MSYVTGMWTRPPIKCKYHAYSWNNSTEQNAIVYDYSRWLIILGGQRISKSISWYIKKKEKRTSYNRTWRFLSLTKKRQNFPRCLILCYVVFIIIEELAITYDGSFCRIQLHRTVSPRVVASVSITCEIPDSSRHNFARNFSQNLLLHKTKGRSSVSRNAVSFLFP